MATTKDQLKDETEAIIQIALARLKRIAEAIEAVCDWYSDSETRFSIEVVPSIWKDDGFDYRCFDGGRRVGQFWCGKNGRDGAIRWLIHNVVESKMEQIEALDAQEIHSPKE